MVETADEIVCWRLPLSEDDLRRRLTGLPGAFWLQDEERWFAGALPSADSRCVDPAPRVLDEPAAEDVPLWVGVLPYEAFRYWERHPVVDRRPAPLLQRPHWRRYPAVVRSAPEGPQIVGTRAATWRLRDALEQTRTLSPAPVRLALREPLEGEDLHRQRITRALEAIGRGDLYQVNLARRFCFSVQGHPLALLERLGPLAEAPFSAALDLGSHQVVSTSPELFLDHRGDQVSTRPIKGTRPRHPDVEEDSRLAQQLDSSDKEQAELTMVVDLERNDLGRLAVPGSVRLTEAPRVVSHPTVHHREATVSAQLRPEVTRHELLVAMTPSGSVTGAPKVAAMELLAELEAHRRGLYTGALGFISRRGRLRLSMAIRVLTARAGVAHYFAGGGIVADSDPEQELHETLWKAEQLRALTGPLG